MFKFIRRYQKWLLVVFCAVLMVAFLIQPVMSIFFPDPSKRTIGTAFDGQKVTENQKQASLQSIQLLRSMGFYGIGLYPREQSESDQALAWLLMVRAGEQAGLGASDSEVFTALSLKQSSIKDTDSLDDFAAKKGITRARLLGVVREYLIAEQYRQLVTGETFVVREGYTGSPGLTRVRQENEAIMRVQSPEMQQQLRFLGLQQLGRMPTEAEMQQMGELWANQMLISAAMSGRPRVSDAALRQMVQYNQTKLSGQAVVFDAEDSTLPPSEEALTELFNAHRADFVNFGEPYGFGYREPAKVKLEALRIPFQAVLAVAAEQVTEADVRRYYDQNVSAYADWVPRDERNPEPEPGLDEGTGANPDAGTEGEGEGTPEGGGGTGEEGTTEEGTPEDATPEGEASGEEPAEPGTDGTAPGEPETDPTQPSEGGGAAGEPDADTQSGDEANTEADTPEDTNPQPRVRIDFRLRKEIRAYLAYEKARELQREIVADAMRMLAEDARVLDERDGYKVIPDGFTPTPLSEIAERLTDEHGVELEIIEDNGEWVALPDFAAAVTHAARAIQQMPTRSVYSAQGDLLDQPTRIPGVELSGRIGLMSSMFRSQQGSATLQQILGQTLRELKPEGQAAAQVPVQTGLALPIPLEDMTRSAYLARVTDAQRDRPAVSLDAVREDVERDARRLAGYETLLGREDELLRRARENSILDIAPGSETTELSGFSRNTPPTLEGIRDAGPLVDAAFELAETLRRAGGVDQADASDRLVAVRFPRERKLVVFLLDDFRPISRQAYQTMLSDGQGSTLTRLARERVTPRADNAGLTDPYAPLTLNELIRLTGFEYAEDEGPASDDGATDGGGDEDA